MLTYVFHPSAAHELEEAVAYYEALSPGKGLELAEQVGVAVLQLCQFPESAPVLRENIRAVTLQPSSRWHYSLHYRLVNNTVRILAISHHARQPFYWLGRH